MTSKLNDSERAEKAALKLLSARPRSRRRLLDLLARKGFSAAGQKSAIARLEELGYLDDQRFAKARALALFREGKLGQRSVHIRLLAQGVTESVARRAISDAMEELPFHALDTARALLSRRRLVDLQQDDRLRAKAARMLLSRGFEQSVIEQLLGEAGLDSPQQGG